MNPCPAPGLWNAVMCIGFYVMLLSLFLLASYGLAAAFLFGRKK